MDTGAIRSVLAGSKVRIALLGILVVVGSVGGAFALGVLGTPSVAAVDNTFGDVTAAETTIETDLVVSNPNPVGIGLGGVSVNYTVSMNSIEMAQGGREGIRIGTGNSTLAFETRMRNDAIPAWWTSHLRNDERTTVEIDATAASDRLGRGVDFTRTRGIETDLLGAFDSEETRPVNAGSPLVDDPVLYVNETRGRWGSVSEAETPIDMAFVVYNPNLEPYVVTEIGYDVTMNDVEMGSGRTDEEYVIPSRSSETVELTTVLDNERLDEWWVTHLDEEVHAHQVSELRIEFYVVIEGPTGEELTVPLDALTYEETIETDVFDEGEDVRDSTSASDGGTETGGDGGSTDADGGSSDDGTTDGSTDDGNETGSDDDGVLPL
ncbi:LEA14-like dessication related protein [Halorubrum aquaticum]|uniref:LEA14-like dessication related protein n=1 Tax=Halorubrum aquaticum TaxID=387340 RepID=A0A1I3AZF0_9EURY|nr:LEA type 2 family protein [Halorubrum aquaticum]SFH55488.1 LEA14-like dessication related protein [Halorubrum aquaticum]